MIYSDEEFSCFGICSALPRNMPELDRGPPVRDDAHHLPPGTRAED